MKNILFATTALVATAGIASADVTFSGKGEAGVFQAEKTAAVAAVAGRATTASYAAITAAASATAAATATSDTVEYVDGVLTVVAAGGTLGTVVANAADGAANVADSVNFVKNAIALKTGEIVIAEALIVSETATLEALAAASTNETIATQQAVVNVAKDALALDKAELAALQAQLANLSGSAAVAETKAGDMTAYSGYDMNVAVSATTDSGLTFKIGFDMGAGQIADQDDDRTMDTQGASIGVEKMTLSTAGGTSVVIGQNKIDDLYDDSQNGDISVSGSMNGLSFTVVHDLDDSVAAVAASTNYTVEAAAATQANVLDGTYAAADFSTTAAVAAVNEGTSVKLGYTVGAATLGFVATSANDNNNSANKVSLGYTVSDALSFSVAQDSKGKADGITSASVTYAVDALTFTVSYADDKNHSGNSNDGGKASTNLKVGYAQGPISATFATDESSQWWVNTKYDLGGGASAFATIDHQEFAVAGLSFAF